MFDRISVDSQQGSKPEPRRWVSVCIRENLIFPAAFPDIIIFFFPNYFASILTAVLPFLF